MNFGFKKFNIDLVSAAIFLVRPLVTILLWFIVDHLLIMIHSKSKFIERLFANQAKDESRRNMIKHRVKTFRGLMLQSVRLLNGVFFIFVLLGHFRIDPKPLLAGIGVVGLGLSLAAQNILRDFINGLFIIIEDQYNIGDWVGIDSFAGTVESFTMRVTRLRATDGRLIIIPNGTISQVVNSTKNFSVALVEIGVSYGTDIPKALSVLDACAQEVARNFQNDVLSPPTAQGITSFGASDIQLRVLMKTLPGSQWGIERALRVAIKESFEKEGIEIPFPQMVVHST
ncbi:MAG: mechanosensitive ion channel family protein [Synergistaceae bacterium]|nr:mechanosensitive ion channel family protein [Synergistaceae bacterium]